MDKFIIPLIFGIIVVVRLIKAAGERQEAEREDDWDDSNWDEWKPDAEPPSPPPVGRRMPPAVPPVVAQRLVRPQPQQSTPPRPRVTKAPPPTPTAPARPVPAVPVRRPASTPSPARGVQPAVRPAAFRPVRTSSAPETPAQTRSAEMKRVRQEMTLAHEAAAAVNRRSREVAKMSLGAAMPDRARLVQAVRVGARRRVPLEATGRQRLRQAILMREVLARPRAFDL